MNEFNYLQFFDKKGQNHQFELDENNVYQGAINLPRISINLIETEHLFILEEFVQGFGKPKAISLGHTFIELNIGKMAEGTTINFTDNNGQTYLFARNSYTFLHQLVTDIQTVIGALAPYNVTIVKDVLTIEILHDAYFSSFGYEYKNFPLLVESVDGVKFTINTTDYYPRFRLRFEDSDDVGDKSTKMFFYDVKVQDNVPYITKFDSIERLLNYDSTDTQDYITFQKSTSNLLDGASVINVGFQSDVEVYELNKIIIEYSNRIGVYSTIAEIEVYGESVEEEERFKHVLANFGRNIPENDYFCFRESDIKEDNIDYQILNAKRKEYLLQLSQLDPYIGSYKGLLNALKFFGYADLRIKEYWTDLSKDQSSPEKYVLVNIEGGDKDVTRSTQFRKTNMFSLIYDLNVVTDDEDEFGIPITEETFQFSFEEIILKLFCLKDILKRDYMPPNSKIVSITGEGDYFDVYNIKSWNHEHTSTYVDVGIDIDWTTVDTFGLIREVRTILYEDWNPSNVDQDIIYSNDTPLLNADYANTFNEHFINLPSDHVECFPTRKGSEVGFPIHLETQSFDLSWDEADFTWDNVITFPNSTWDTLGFFEFYELEWQVCGSEGYALEQNFILCERGSIADFIEHRIIVPYIGKYTVTLKGIELNGNISYETKHSEIEVDMYNADFVLVANLVDIVQIKTWNDMNNISWNDISGTWDLPKITDSEYDQGFSNWDSLKLNQYCASDYKTLNIDTNLYEPLSPQLLNTLPNVNYFDWNKYVDFRIMDWNKLEDISFSQIDNVNWRAFEFDYYEHAGFEITNVFPSGVSFPSLTINGVTYNLGPYTAPPTPQIEWDMLATNLEATFTEWEFTARPLGASTFIHAVYKHSSYNEADYTFSSVDWNISPVNYSNGYYLYDDIFINRSGIQLGVGSPFLLIPDASKIFGKSEIKWRIYDNKTNEKLLDINNLWLHFVIPFKGLFDIEAEIIDSNGNTKIVRKNSFIVSI